MSYQSDVHHRYAAWPKLRHTLAIIRQEPANLLAVLLLLLFSGIILAPVISVLLNAVLVQSGDEGRTAATEGTFTSWYLVRTLSSRMSDLLLWTPLLNTLAVAFSTVAGALVVGVALAWLINRTDMAGKRGFSTLLIVPFMLPSWTFALAWNTLFKNHAIGGQPGWLEAMGFQTPDWVAYGYFPIVVIMMLHYAPLVILIVGNALKRMDSQMEESARVLGASRAAIAFKIIVPLMRPALLSAALLIFADCIGEFALPYILGLPVHFDTLSTGLYRAIGTRQSGVAAVIATVIMLMGMLTLALDMKMLREAKRFVTVGGKGVMDRRSRLGRWRVVASALPLLFVLLGVVIPLLTLFLSTIMTLPGRFTRDNFTLAYWIGHHLDTVAMHNGILLTAEFWQAIGNTLLIVGSASVVCGVLGLLVGYAVMRSHSRWLSSALRQLTFLPYLVPGIAFATAFLSLFAVARGPVPALYGTPFILVLALIAEKMPYASRSGIAAMTQLGKEAEEAARIAGAGWFARLRQIVIPIQAAPLATGILLPFISGIKGVSLFVILATPATDVMTTYSLRLIDYNYQQAANAVVLMIALISWAGTVLIQKVTGTGLAESLEK
ncbi:ABC transporter permease [Candidatus Pantoea multigeneris]|uniref:Iron ABC transporter permease n=1 Tax=Candidatus Pantoea multigeneris TaxID=2608357 RepID=A0ABX0RAX4_9GAMM|nr:iron ABC transporter permease [Pantoea multigeneris]